MSPASSPLSTADCQINIFTTGGKREIYASAVALFRFAYLVAGDGAPMHPLRPVGVLHDAAPRPAIRERRGLRETLGAEGLHRAVGDRHLHARHRDLDQPDLLARRLVAESVHQPCRLEDEKARLLDLDARERDPLADRAVLVQLLAEGGAL